MRAFAGRLEAQGEPRKLALIVSARKFLIALNAMMKEGRIFKNSIAWQASIQLLDGRSRHIGVFKGGGIYNDPASAAHLFRLRRAGDNE